ncbi:ureidoglycolate hydrolase [Cladorrhinum sp. PSN259]|nr:ureidoglycolate hydrolase [Cladorrhinum sp. PSN259]
MARIIQTEPLTRQSFAPFGDVIENPRPELHPFAASTTSTPLPFDAISANQGSAIKYQHVSRQVNLYPQAPSGVPGVSVMNMFVCAARVSIPPSTSNPTTFPLRVLERHPYTTQTFIPLSNPTDSSRSKNYLVIVAPTLPSGPNDRKDFPVPGRLDSDEYPRLLPGRGMPDLSKLRAFVATSPQQAVTYGAGTWHAPMVTLGEKGTFLDFLVVQFANGVAAEDCQEVYFEGNADEKVVVQVNGSSEQGITAKF